MQADQIDKLLAEAVGDLDQHLGKNSKRAAFLFEYREHVCLDIKSNLDEMVASRLGMLLERAGNRLAEKFPQLTPAERACYSIFISGEVRDDFAKTVQQEDLFDKVLVHLLGGEPFYAYPLSQPGIYVVGFGQTLTRSLMQDDQLLRWLGRWYENAGASVEEAATEVAEEEQNEHSGDANSPDGLWRPGGLGTDSLAPERKSGELVENKASFRDQGRELSRNDPEELERQLAWLVEHEKAFEGAVCAMLLKQPVLFQGIRKALREELVEFFGKFTEGIEGGGHGGQQTVPPGVLHFSRARSNKVLDRDFTDEEKSVRKEQRQVQDEVLAEIRSIQGTDQKARTAARKVLRRVKGHYLTEWFVTSLQELFDNRRWGFPCQHDDCKQASARPYWRASVDCLEGGRMLLTHTLEGKTVFHGSFTIYPDLPVVDRPDLRRKRTQGTKKTGN